MKSPVISTKRNRLAALEMASNVTKDGGGKSKGRKSATVKFPCGHCNKTTSGSSALMCNICEMWHHTDCIEGMTGDMYKNMLSMKEVLGYTFFLCAKCEKVHKKMWQTVNKMGQRLDSVEKRLDEIEKAIKMNSEKHQETVKKVEKVETLSAVNSEKVKSSVLSEVQEQENRKTNIVVYNLEESNKDEGEARKVDDLGHINQILQVIDVSVDSEEDIVTVRRLGKLPKAEEEANTLVDDQETVAAIHNKPRPLLITFSSPNYRSEVLYNAKKLSKSNLKHISVCPDLTKLQQKEDKKLRDEASTLNAEKPSDEKGSFLWKVVGMAGQPSRRKIKIYAANPNI